MKTALYYLAIASGYVETFYALLYLDFFIWYALQLYLTWPFRRFISVNIYSFTLLDLNDILVFDKLISLILKLNKVFFLSHGDTWIIILHIKHNRFFLSEWFKYSLCHYLPFNLFTNLIWLVRLHIYLYY